MRADDGTKVDAWMPLYVGDWDGDTAHLSCEEDGAYGRLVRWYWRNGPPPDDDEIIGRIVRMPVTRWRKVRRVVALFFVIADGRWTHNRVEAELAAWADKKRGFVERARAAGIARATKAGQKMKPQASRKLAASSRQAQLELSPSPSAPTGEVIDTSPRRGREAPLLPDEGQAALTPAERDELERSEARGVQGPGVERLRRRRERFGVQGEPPALKVVGGTET